MAVLAIWGQSMRDERFHIINHCLVPCLPFPPLAGFPLSPVSSSLQPPASLLFWQLFLMLTEPPTDSILLLDCGFLSPASPAFLSFPPLCLFLIVIRGTWHFLFHMMMWREELSCSAWQTVRSRRLEWWVDTVYCPTYYAVCVCVCMHVRACARACPEKIERIIFGVFLCQWLLINIKLWLMLGTILMHRNVYFQQNWGWLWSLSQNIFVFHPRAISL